MSRVPMLCECSDPDCEVVFLIGLEEYAAARDDPWLFLTAPGHEVSDGRCCGSTPDFWLQRRLA